MQRDVSFASGSAKLVGTLHLPDHSPSPAIIVTGSWLTVKEQMPASYAPLLRDAGFAALTFDFTGFGQSEGSPRDVESARTKANDLRAAVRFLQTLREVQATQIGILAICASAGYATVAAIDEPGLRSIVMVAPWLHDASIVRQIYGGETGVATRIAQARRARTSFEQTGTVDYVKAASNTDPTAAMYWEGDALDYYLNPARGAVPQWGNRFAVMAWEEWLAFDPIALASKLAAPTRIITGPGTATAGGAQQFAAALRAPHDLVNLDGTQFDFYDNPAVVGPAAASAVAHFRSTL